MTKITIEIPPELHKKYKLKSVQENSNMTEITLKLIQKYIGDE